MKVRMGTLRKFLCEVLDGIDETDLMMMGGGSGPGDAEDDMKIADHLRGDGEKRSLGDPPDETVGENLLRRELLSFFMQEGPAGASGTDPREQNGFYATFNMERDHGDAANLSSPWYKSPGRQAGQDGDPYRSADPYAQLGFHPPKAGSAHPAVDGTQARLAPPIWQLSAGGDTSAVLGANARPASGGVESGGEQEDGEEGTGLEGKEEDEAEGSEQGTSGNQRSRDR